MVAVEAFAREDEIRRRLRRSQIANSLVILLIAAGILFAAAFLILRMGAWHFQPRPSSDPLKIVAAPAPVASVSHAKAVPAATALAVTPAPPVVEPKAEASSARALAPKSMEVEVPASPPLPTVFPEPREPPEPPEPPDAGGAATAEPAPIALPSGGAAKQMLNSIKCYDRFAFDYQKRARRYFSAQCLGGNRMQVSCIGAGCKIEYAPPPSHVPDG